MEAGCAAERSNPFLNVFVLVAEHEIHAPYFGVFELGETGSTMKFNT